MAIIWADFPSGQRGLYGSNVANMLNGVWAEIRFGQLVNDPDPVIGSAGIVFETNAQGGVDSEHGRFVIPAEVTTLGLAFRLWMAKLPTNADSCPYFSFRDNANNGIFTVLVTTTGQLAVYAGGDIHGFGLGALLGTSVPVLVANAYMHIETKGTKGAGTGAIEIRVNGAEKLDLSGLALSANNIAQVIIGCKEQSIGSDAAMIAYYKDFIVWDTAGAYANDFQGSVAVHDLLPDADISLNWTPSSGATGWNLLDENPPDDGDYIEADATPPAAAVLGLTNLPPDVTSVRALLPIFRGQKTDGGDCDIQTGLTPDNVAWVNGANRPMTTAFTYWWDAMHTSPVTAAPWTPAEVNGAYVRVNRTL